MTETLPAPLLAPEVDLTDFQFMPVEVRRLLTSETWLTGTGDEKAAAMTLWLESWHQVPCGSLPDNDKMLAHLSQSGAKWKKVRAAALRGWRKCSDGRLYHPVVCEKALESWGKKESYRERTEAARAAKEAKRISQQAQSANPTERVTAPVTKSVTEAATEPVTETVIEPVTALKGEGEGEGEKKERDSVDDDFSTWYAAYPLHKGRGQALRAYRAARKKADVRTLLAGATRYAADSTRDPRYTKHPATWLNGECWADDAAGPDTDPLAIPASLNRTGKPSPNGWTYMGRPTPLRDGHPIRVEHQHLTAWLSYDGLWSDPWMERKPASVDEARTRIAALEPSIWPNAAETLPNPTTGLTGGPKPTEEA
jgi:hypothetical protein